MFNTESLPGESISSCSQSNINHPLRYKGGTAPPNQFSSTAAKNDLAFLRTPFNPRLRSRDKSLSSTGSYSGIGMGLVATGDGVPTDYARSNAASSREPVSRNDDDIINNWRSFRENIRSNVA